jgi:hypothetical protein
MNHPQRVLARSVLVLMMTLTAWPALAQVDLSGIWAPRLHEDLPYKGGGPTIGDYLGLPINDEARARAAAWQESLQAKPEHQCIMYSAFYVVLQPFGLQFLPETDPISGQVIAWKVNGVIDRAPLTIWMDGRPHPSKSAAHTTSGFTTGVWDGDTLVTTTTHLTEGVIWRNGVPHSDLATVTGWIARHANTLMITMMLDDPIYLEEPLLRNAAWQLDPTLRITPDTCQPQVEIAQRPEAVPHYLPGTNPSLNEPVGLYKVPPEAARGGAATLYPEFQKKVKAYVPPPAPAK